jgi:hypothetical protein
VTPVQASVYRSICNTSTPSHMPMHSGDTTTMYHFMLTIILSWLHSSTGSDRPHRPFLALYQSTSPLPTNAQGLSKDLSGGKALEGILLYLLPIQCVQFFSSSDAPFLPVISMVSPACSVSKAAPLNFLI